MRFLATLLALCFSTHSFAFFVGEESTRMNQVTTSNGATVILQSDFENYSEVPAAVLGHVVINGENVLIVDREGERVALAPEKVFELLSLRVVAHDEPLAQAPDSVCTSSCVDDIIGGALGGMLSGGASGAAIGGAIGGGAGAYVAGPPGIVVGGAIGGGVGAAGGAVAGAISGGIEKANACAKDKAEACAAGN